MTTFAFVFPGQGSQAVGMLDAWGDNTAVRNTLAEASDALGEDIERRSRRSGELQRSEADRHRWHEGRRREGLRGAEGRGREARAAAAGVGAVPFEPDEARC